ncbi:MAG: Bud-site selection protein [Linnemannia elongata]|nr:MAG: Bud-site selection protein [Linnemannia elongata]
MKGEHKGGKKKDNLGWEIIKLQAQVGESTSRKAKKIVEAERKKEHGTASTSTSTSEVVEEGQEQDQEAAVLSEAAQKLLKLKEQKISQKIYHAKKEIRKAFVKAKAFETQRLVKRLREARKAVEEKENKSEAKDEDKPVHKKKQDLTQEDVTKFENEIELVKKMDMDSLSEHAFVAKLAKHPILGSHTLMAPYTTKKETAASSGSQEDAATIQIIEARLTNTKTVKEHMSKLWDELENIITGKKANEEKNKKRKGSDDQDESKNKKRKAQKDTKKGESDHEESEEDEDVEMDGVDLSDISDSEREDDGYDSDGLPLPMGGKSSAGSSSSMASMFIGSLNESGKKDKKDKKGKKDKNDWVDDKFDEIYGKVKKNRPGQQARRAKAERKFGKEANHIKKAEEEARIRAEKKAARKAKQEKFNAQRDASTANAQRLPNRRTIGAGDGSASIVQPPKPRAKPVPAGPDLNDPTLHPSWIAKQTEKAAMAAALSGAKSNKITFDDSD